MAEAGTKVGTGYVDIVGDFRPLHRQLEQFRTVWQRQTRGLGLSLQQSMRPAVAGATRDLDRSTRASALFISGLARVDRSAKAAGRSTDALARSIDLFGLRVGRTGDRAKQLGLILPSLTARSRQLASTLDALQRRQGRPNTFGALGMQRLAVDLDRLRSSASRSVDRFRVDTDTLGQSLRRLQRISASLPRTLNAAGMPAIARDIQRAARSVDSFGAAAQGAGREAQSGFRRGLQSLRDWGQASNRARGDALRLERAQIGLRMAVDRHGATSLQARDAQLRLDQAHRRSATGVGLAGRAFAGLGGRMTVVNQRFQLLRNALMVLRWPAIITGAGLAAQALSGLAAAVVAVTSAVGPAVGVLGALPGALAAAAQGFGVMRLATLGIGDALREQLRVQTGLASGGQRAVDASRAVEAAERSQADASRRLADAKDEVRFAEEGLDVARGEAARSLEDARRAVTEATNDEQRATRELHDARAALAALQAGPDELDLADARDRTADATRAITEAERDYQDEIVRTNEILADPRATSGDRARAQIDLANAEDRVADARRGSERAARDLSDLENGPSGRELADARLGIADAEARVTDARVTRRRATQELADLEERGIARSEQVVDAQRRLAEAHEGVEDAQRGVQDAARAVSDALEDASAAQAQATGTAADLNEEFNRLPASAQEFVRTLIGLKPRFDELRSVAADGLLPGARSGLLSAMRSFNPIRRVVDLTSRAIGGLARVAGRLIGSAGFGRDLELIGGRNADVIRRVGRAAIVAGDALRHVMVAAGPLLGWLSRVSLGWAESWRESARAGRESGRLARFFTQTRRVLERLGSITGNVARAFRGIGRAAAPLGREILAALDRASERWARWTHSFRGQNVLKRYFDDSRPAIWEMGRLLRDITTAFFRLGSQPGVARMLAQVRTEMLPAFERLLRVLSQTFGPALIRAITNVVKLFSELAGGGGVLATMVKFLDRMVVAFTWMLRSVPGLRQLVFLLAGAAGAFTALRIFSVVTGFGRLAGAIARVTMAYRGLRAGAAAVDVASRAGVGATATARVAAAGSLAGLFSPAGMLRAAGGRAAVTLAGSRLGGLLGSGITSGIGAAFGGGAAGGAAAGAVGGAAAGGASGLMSKIKGGLTRAAKAGGLAGAGLAIGQAVMDEASNHMAERSRNLLTRLGGYEEVSFGETVGSMVTGNDGAFRERSAARELREAYEQMQRTRVRMSMTEVESLRRAARSLDLTRAERAEVDRMISTLARGSRLRIGVSLNLGAAATRIENSFRLLRSGALSNLRDIVRVSRRNMRLIAETLGSGSADGRRAMSRNMRLTADAIQTQMRRSGRVTDEGVQRIVRLIRNADLINPTRRLARDFGREWARGMDRTGEATRRSLERMLTEARKMPGPMRKVALETWLGQLEAARRNGRLTKREFEDLRSAVATEFTGMRTESKRTADTVPRNVGNMTNAATDAFSVLTGNTNKALSAFGVRPLNFRFEKVREQKRQRGGAIVPGTGSGDTFHTALPAGSFILNRNATSAYGFNRGGMVPVALEPRERVFLPDEVRRVGLGRLQTMNAAVPRFGGRRERHQTGGLAGRSFDVQGANPGFVPFMNYLNSLFGPIYVMSGYFGRENSTIAGSGGRSNHADRNAVDISTQQNGLNMAYNAATLNATGAAAARMDALYAHMARYIPTSTVSGDFLWRTDDGGNHWNHIHRGITNGLQESASAMAQFLSKLPEGSGFGALQRLLLTGPDGPLKTLGQAAINKLYRAANSFVMNKSAVPTFGTGRLVDVPHGGKVVGASVFGDPVDDPSTGYIGYRDNDLRGQDAYAELGMGTLLGGLPYRHPLTIAYNGKAVRATKQDIGLGGDPIQGHSTDIDIWHETADKLGIHGLWKGLVSITGAMQRGGLVHAIQALQRGGITGGIDRISRFFRKPLKGRERGTESGYVARVLRLIQGIGVPAELQAQLTELSNRADISADLAQRAGSLSYEMLYGERTPILNPDGSPVLGSDRRPTFYEIGDPILDAERRPMTFFAEANGRTEEGWTQHRLGALFDLRNKLVNAKDIVFSEQGRVARLIEQTRRRIAEIVAAISRAERRKRQLRRSIARTARRITEQRADLTRELETLRTERETLDRLRERPRANRERIQESRERIWRSQQRIATLGQSIDGLEARRAELTDRVRVIDGEQGRRRRTEAHLTSVLGNATDNTGLLGRQQSMADYMPELLGSSGGSFKGLQVVQGAGGPETLLAALPPIGVLGGEIFDTQQILRQLGTKPNPVPSPEPVEPEETRDDAERLSLLQQLLQEWQQRFVVSQAQYGALEGFNRDFPLPGYGGSFATGGVVPGAVGEARTIIAHGGERVIPVGGENGGGVLQVLITDQRVVAVGPNGEEVRAIVRDETRRQARGAVLSGPGSRMGR